MRERPAGALIGQRPRWLVPESLFVAGAICQYAGAAVAVLLFDRVPAGAVAWLRVLTAALVLLAWRRPSLGATPADWRLRAIFGCALAAMNLTFYEAIDRIPVGTAVAIEFSGPMALAALRSQTCSQYTAVGVAALGVLLLGGLRAASSPVGIALALLAGALWALYTVTGHRIAARGGGVDALALAMAIGALAIAPLTAPHAGSVIEHPWLLGVCVAVGLLSSVVPYALDQVAMRLLSQRRFAISLAILPATATLVAAVVLGQIPGPTEALGIALVSTGVALASREATVGAVARAPGA